MEPLSNIQRTVSDSSCDTPKRDAKKLPFGLGMFGIGGSKKYRNASGNTDPWFVAAKDIPNNTLYVVQGHDHPWLMSSGLEAGQASWIAGEAPQEVTLSAKTRYRQADVPCECRVLDQEAFEMAFPVPQWAVTPGQSACMSTGVRGLAAALLESPVLPERRERRRLTGSAPASRPRC